MTDKKRLGHKVDGTPLATWECRSCRGREFRRHKGKRYCRRCGKNNG